LRTDGGVLTPEQSVSGAIVKTYCLDCLSCACRRSDQDLFCTIIIHSLGRAREGLLTSPKPAP
jgi:hypothetical protein